MAITIDPTTWEVPLYPRIFDVVQVWNWAIETHKHINERMYGSIAMTEEDSAILAAAVVSAGDGDHLEIGSLFGGSAILAAMAKKKFKKSGSVYCVDDNRATHENVIMTNAQKFDVSLVLHVGNSDPLPFQNRFASALIDASHDYNHCLTDWQNAKQLVDKYIIFHDYDRSHPGVMRAGKGAMAEWDAVYISGHTLVLENQDADH